MRAGSPDGKRVADGLQARADGWLDDTRLAVLDVATRRTMVLAEGWENSVAEPMGPEGANSRHRYG
jgi:hypothetical protein